MDQAENDRSVGSRRGTLGWTVFLVVAVVVVAALFAGAIHRRLPTTAPGGSRPSLSGAPSPSPTPLPRPGPAPPGTEIA